MKIIKRKDDDSKITEIQLKIPLNIQLFGERDFEECAETALNDLNIKTMTAFEHLGFLTQLAENKDVKLTHYFEMVYLLCHRKKHRGING